MITTPRTLEDLFCDLSSFYPKGLNSLNDKISNVVNGGAADPQNAIFFFVDSIDVAGRGMVTTLREKWGTCMDLVAENRGEQGVPEL